MRSPIAALSTALEARIGRSADPPSVWPVSVGALVSHAAIVALLVLVVTGVALAVPYRPSVEVVIYRGSSALYDAQALPAAFASVVRISEDLPGGLLLRRLHVAAAHLLAIAVIAHMLRTLATGAFRRPRLATHLTGVGLLLVVLGFFYTGELLPFGLVAGSSLRIAEAVVGALPFVGEELVGLLFAGELPSQRFLTLAWVGHAYLLPAALVGLLGVHLVQVHRRRPSLPPRHDVDVAVTASGRPLWPDAVARFALLTTGLTAVLLLSSAIVPWSDLELEGPFLTAEATNTVHPPWPLFFLTGGLRVVPAIDVVVGGARITNVLVAGVLLPGVLITALAAYPFIERAVIGEPGRPHVRQRLLDVPFRAVAVSVMTTFAVVLTLSAGVDVLSFWFPVPVEAVVVTFRVLLVVAPFVAGGAAWWAANRRQGRAT